MKLKLLSAFAVVKNFTIANSPIILAVVSIIGLVFTVIMAIKQVAKARRNLDDAYARFGDDIRTSDKIRAVVVPFIPVIISLVLTIASIVTGTFISNRRITSAIQAANVAQATLTTVEEKIKSELGDKAADTVHEAVTKERIAKAEKESEQKGTPVSEYREDQSNFFDETSGRIFYSSLSDLKKAENDINADLVAQLQYGVGGWYLLNDAYAHMGLEDIDVGNALGWDIERTGLITLNTTPIIRDGKPYISVRFSTKPYPNTYGKHYTYDEIY